MTQREFLLPDLGEGLTEGEIATWLVEVGDRVEIDQPLAEIETAKAIVEIPSPFEGVVAVRHAEVGAEIEVGTPLITIDTAPSSPADEQEPVTESKNGAAPTENEPGDTSEGAAVANLVPDSDEDTGSGNVLVGYGTEGGTRSRRRRGGGDPAAGAGIATTGPSSGRGNAARPLAKPPVRKMAKDLGVDLAQITPSGSGGVVTRDDVRAAAAGSGQQEARDVPSDVDERIPMKGVRKMIAQKMTQSRAEIPEATSWVDCDATGLMDARRQLNDVQADVRVSPLALIMRICVAGLRAYPMINARLDTDNAEIVVLDAIHLGFAAQTDRGLVVPVIRHAHTKTTLDIAGELNDLAAVAREGKLSPEAMTGSTFSVSNYGSFGVDGGAPVINYPEAAILGVGRIIPRPWVHQGEIAVRDVLQISIAFDHRICDGAEAAGFLRFIADCIETPALLLGNI